MRLSNDQASLRLLVSLTVAVFLMLCGMWFTGLSLDISSLGVLLPVSVFQVVLFAYCRFRSFERFQPVVETMLLFTLSTFVILPITYAAVRFGMPITDDWLSRLDMALMFDWQATIRFVDQYPLLAVVLQLSYLSFHFQLLVLPIFFASLRNTVRGQAIVFAYLAIAIVSSAISIWFPAYGAYITYGVGQSDVSEIVTNAAFSFVREFDAVRGAAEFTMSLERVEGILTFPSVHAGVAVLCVWAAAGSRLLFWPFVVLNAAMACAAITHGSHYLVDILAGFVVAAACIAVTIRLFPGCGIRQARLAERALLAELRNAVPWRRRQPAIAGEIASAPHP